MPIRSATPAACCAQQTPPTRRRQHSTHTHNSPTTHPHAGWYANAFSHARRVLYTADSPDAALPADNPALAYWDGKDCMSNWALNARG